MANSVALGAGSVTTVGALSNYIAYGLSSPQSSAGEFNIDNRQITGVAAGKAGTDAVNVSQLDAVSTQLTTLINQRTTNGGGSLSSSPGTPTPPASTGWNSSSGGQGASASASNSTAVGNSSQASATGATAVGVGAAASGNNSVALGSNSTDGGRSNVVSVGSSHRKHQDESRRRHEPRRHNLRDGRGHAMVGRGRLRSSTHNLTVRRTGRTKNSMANIMKQLSG